MPPAPGQKKGGLGRLFYAKFLRNRVVNMEKKRIRVAVGVIENGQDEIFIRHSAPV